MCAEDLSEYLYSYEQRLLTFERWPRALSPALLAKAGFYYTGEKDVVRCFYCKSDFHQWDATDDPLSDHIRDVPNCRFAKLLALSYNNERHQLKKEKEGKTHQNDTKNTANHTTTISDIDTENKVSYTQYVSLNKRFLLFFMMTMYFLNIFLLFKM